jgi:hypothetical protein
MAFTAPRRRVRSKARSTWRTTCNFFAPHSPADSRCGDEWSLILAGEAEEEGTGARWIAGDLVHRPPGSAHAYRAVSREPLVFAVVLHGGIQLERD